jgi:hypothetical protein
MGRAVALGLLAAACGKDSTGPRTEAGAQVNADLARTAGDLAVAQLTLLNLAEAAVPVLSAGAGAPGALACAYSAAAGRWTCAGPPATPLTGSLSLGFTDTQGSARPLYDSLTTARIDVSAAYQGSAAGQGFTASVAGELTAALTGLAGRESARTWNGAGSTTLAAAFTGEDGARDYHLISQVELRDVVVAVPRQSAWPASGTLTYRLAGQQTVDGRTLAFDQTAVVTFQGGQTATVQTGGKSYTLNLATRAVR